MPPTRSSLSATTSRWQCSTARAARRRRSPPRSSVWRGTSTGSAGTAARSSGSGGSRRCPSPSAAPGVRRAWRRASPASRANGAGRPSPRGVPEELLCEPLDVAGLDLPLVRLHDVAHQAADLLRIGDGERGDALAGEVAFAEFHLEAELGDLGPTALARLLELGDRLLELLPVGPDDVTDEGVVHLAGETLRGTTLLEPGLQHPHHVGGPRVPFLDRLPEPFVELLLESHRHHAGAKRAVNSRTFFSVSTACTASTTRRARVAPSAGETSSRNFATSSSGPTGFSASPRGTVVVSSRMRPSRSATLTCAVG